MAVERREPGDGSVARRRAVTRVGRRRAILRANAACRAWPRADDARGRPNRGARRLPAGRRAPRALVVVGPRVPSQLARAPRVRSLSGAVAGRAAARGAGPRRRRREHAQSSSRRPPRVARAIVSRRVGADRAARARPAAGGSSDGSRGGRSAPRAPRRSDAAASIRSRRAIAPCVAASPGERADVASASRTSRRRNAGAAEEDDGAPFASVDDRSASATRTAGRGSEAASRSHEFRRARSEIAASATRACRTSARLFRRARYPRRPSCFTASRADGISKVGRAPLAASRTVDSAPNRSARASPMLAARARAALDPTPCVTSLGRRAT